MLISGEALWVEGRRVWRIHQLPTVCAWVAHVWPERDRGSAPAISIRVSAVLGGVTIHRCDLDLFIGQRRSDLDNSAPGQRLAGLSWWVKGV